MPSALLAIPLAGLALVVASAVFLLRPTRREGRPLAATLGWLAVPVALLALTTLWCALGLYAGGAAELAALCLAALLAAAAALGRARLLAALRRRVGPVGTEVLLAVPAVAGCTALGFLAIEVPYNAQALSMGPLARVEAAIVLAALLLLYLVFQRRGAGLVLGVALCAVIGIGQFFLVSFKDTALLPNDLFALGTAVAVSGSYVYVVDGAVALALACVSGASALGALVTPAPAATRRARTVSVCANLAGAALVAAALVAGVGAPDYAERLGVRVDYWFTLDCYREQGLLTTFVAIAHDLPIDVPEGYSAPAAAELEQAYAAAYDETLGATPERQAVEAQYAAEQPTVIAIMNETFSDLSVYDGASWGYAGPSFYNSVDDALARGSLAVSVLGGGTCNSEFEFLTGVSLADVGAGKYPYQLYDLSGAPSLAKQLSALGYSTCALHPNEATNWRRNEVYQELGFDRFLSIEDFEGAETYHSGVTDAATYDKILELLAEDAGPQFIFDVTMQNHSGYDQNNIPAEDLADYAIDGFGDYDNAQLNEYLACIESSDRALEDFLAALSELDRPVVVVFFGDHQPYLSTALNGTLFGYEDANSLEHLLRAYQTTYLVWANYDVAGSAQSSEKDDASVAYLAAMALQAAGVPLTDYQKAQLVVREEMPSVSLVGWQDSDRAWHVTDDQSADQSRAFSDLAQITYLEFADKLE